MQLVPHDFNAYELTAEEELQSQLLTQLQSARLQNLLAKASRDKIDIQFDPDKPLHFAQQEAFASGQIQLLRYLLDCNTVAQQQLKGE